MIARAVNLVAALSNLGSHFSAITTSTASASASRRCPRSAAADLLRSAAADLRMVRFFASSAPRKLAVCRTHHGR
jgi:hypothetical protein